MCDKHNNDLAPLAAVLSHQFRFLNALIGVRPDHNKKRPHSAVLTDADGGEYVLSSEKFAVKGGRTISETPLPDGRVEVTMAFGSQEEIDQWIEAEEAAGVRIEPVSRVEQEGLSHGRFRAELTLGGSDGLRAVAYVALTFLAHRFPDVARSPALASYRRFVLEGGENAGFVWWLPPPSADERDPYPFGHKVEVSVPTQGEAVARLTFFSCLSFGINFGRVMSETSGSVITHIDPLALHPPEDIREERLEQYDINLDRPSSQSKTLRDATSTGSAERAFDAFMRKVTDYLLQEDMRPLHSRLIAAKELPSVERRATVVEIVDDNAQRVLNLIRYVADDMRGRLDTTTPAGAILFSYLDAMFPHDATPSAAYKAESDRLQCRARKAIADAIDDALAVGALDLDTLSMLFGGGAGAAVAGKAVLEALTNPQ